MCMLEMNRFQDMIVGAISHPLLCARGAPLYSFPSPHSDMNLRGWHVLLARSLD